MLLIFKYCCYGLGWLLKRVLGLVPLKSSKETEAKIYKK